MKDHFHQVAGLVIEPSLPHPGPRARRVVNHGFDRRTGLSQLGCEVRRVKLRCREQVADRYVSYDISDSPALRGVLRLARSGYA